MNRPLEIRDVENVSLEASDDNSDMYPQLVAQFTCQHETDSDCIAIRSFSSYVYVCCSVVWMINVTRAAIEGISVTVTTPRVSGVILQQCSHLHIQSYIGIQKQFDFDDDQSVGIIAYESSDIEMDSIEVSNFSFGVALYMSRSSSMMNVFAAHNGWVGIWLDHSTDTSMMNVCAVHNGWVGIWLDHSTDTSMMNVSAAHNGWVGIWLDHSTDTSMMNVSAAHNGWDIIKLYALMVGSGIWLRYSTNTSMMNVSAVHNERFGIWLYSFNDTSMMNVFAAHNGDVGIWLEHSTNTSMMNVSAVHNEDFGICLYYFNDTSMMNVFAAHNGDVGIWLEHSTNTSMMNVSAVHNEGCGICLYYSTNASMMNVSAIRMFSCINTSLYYSYTYHNGDGIYIIESRTTHILYLNTENTMYIIKSTDTYILNSVLDEHSDIEMRNTVNTYITNTTSLITAYNTKNIVLNDTLFSNMDAPSTASSTSEPASLPAVISLYSSTLNITDCTFTRNSISSIKTIGSNVTMSGKVLFHNNTASLGTVLISAKNSILITTDYSNIHFQNNHAINYGGVFYITTEESYQTSMSLQDIIQFNFNTEEVYDSLIISRTECFVCVEGSRSHARLTFINNTAGKGGDVLYGGLVALGYDGDWNCLHSFKNISDISQQSGLSFISSAPSRVCLFNEAGQPDCLTVADPTTRVMYPGQTITIPAVVVGQDFGTVNGSVFAQFLHTPYTTDSVDMEPRHSIAVEHSQWSNLEYSIFSQSENSTAVLVLTHDNKEISHLMNVEDNQEITNSWDVINKELNYKTLAQDIICDFFDFTTWPWQFTIKYNVSKQSDNRTIEDLYKFTTALINFPTIIAEVS